MDRRDFVRLVSATAFASAVPAWAQSSKKPAAQPRIVVLGDSLSAEYGLVRGSGWVALLEKRLSAEKIAASVINASISGDTTSGGRARLGALLKQHRPTVLVIELGGNDALRGLPLKNTQDNLSAMAQAAQKRAPKCCCWGCRCRRTMVGSTPSSLRNCLSQWHKKIKRHWCRFCSRGWPTGKTPRRGFRPMAFTRWQRRIRRCSITFGQRCARCCADRGIKIGEG